MAQGDPRPGEKYLHFKNRLYQVISVAYHSETMEKYVVYQALYGDFKTYIRPYEMFISETDHEKYPEVTQKYRFRYLGDGDVSEPVGEPGQRVLTEQCPSASLPEEKTISDPSPEGHLNPWLDKILDARDFDEKYKIVCDMHNDVTDRLIDDIAVVMDLAIPDGDLRSRYEQLKYCLRTRQRYEMGRLRS